jgi:hypothetical protein
MKKISEVPRMADDDTRGDGDDDFEGDEMEEPPDSQVPQGSGKKPKKSRKKNKKQKSKADGNGSNSNSGGGSIGGRSNTSNPEVGLRSNILPGLRAKRCFSSGLVLSVRGAGQ